MFDIYDEDPEASETCYYTRTYKGLSQVVSARGRRKGYKFMYAVRKWHQRPSAFLSVKSITVLQTSKIYD